MVPDPTRRALGLLLALAALALLPSCRTDRRGGPPGDATATLPVSPAATAPSTSRPTTIPAPGYVKPDQFDYRRIMGDPPADDSPEHRAEVARMLDFQATRTPEIVRRCQDEEDVTAFAFATVLGDWFNERDLPQTAAVMRYAFADAKAVSDAAKKVWTRTRPAKANPQIHPCVRPELTPSYPSGHAVRGVVWATLLAEVFPEKRDELMARGRQIGDDRFVAGMHYPTDVAAGQKLGAEVAAKLLASEPFRATLERAKAECLADAAAHR